MAVFLIPPGVDNCYYLVMGYLSAGSDKDSWRDLLKESKKAESPGGTAGRRRFRFSFWYVILAVVLTIVVNALFFQGRDGDSVPYSEFKRLVSEGEIKEVHYSGTALTGYSFLTSEINRGGIREMLRGISGGDSSSYRSWKAERVPQDYGLVELLELKGVVYLAMPESRNYLLDILVRVVLPFGLLFFVVRYLFRRMGGIGSSSIMNFGQNNARIVAEKDIESRFSHVAGCDEAKDELIEIVDFLRQPAKYTSIGGKIPKGALLVGSPGTGKTLLARAVAGESGVTFFRMSGADFVEMFVGVGAARVRDLFRQAREKAPCIVFIDELDAIGKSRSGTMSTNDEREQTLNQLLVEMDGFDSTSGVIILAATNRPEVLDPALLRPGRFDRQVVVEKPDQVGREAILRIHTARVLLHEDVDLVEVSRATAGLAGADLANIVNEAALLAVRFGRDRVATKDFLEAIEKTAIGLEKRNKILNPHEREVTAYHETGHALMNVFTPDQNLVKKITIVPRGYGIMGYMLPVPEEERSFHTREELLGRVDVALGGRAAEEVVYGTVSTGAGRDIKQATEIVLSMITRLGMSRHFVNVSLNRRLASYLGGGDGQYMREYSEETQRLVDEEVAAIIAERYVHVLAMMKKHRKLLEAITSRLMDVETIEREEFMEIVKGSEAGRKAFEERQKADLKPSDRARESGEARNKAIAERVEIRRKQEAEVQAAAEARMEENREAAGLDGVDAETSDGREGMSHPTGNSGESQGSGEGEQDHE